MIEFKVSLWYLASQIILIVFVYFFGEILSLFSRLTTHVFFVVMYLYFNSLFFIFELTFNYMLDWKNPFLFLFIRLILNKKYWSWFARCMKDEPVKDRQMLSNQIHTTLCLSKVTMLLTARIQYSWVIITISF